MEQDSVSKILSPLGPTCGAPLVLHGCTRVVSRAYCSLFQCSVKSIAAFFSVLSAQTFQHAKIQIINQKDLNMFVQSAKYDFGVRQCFHELEVCNREITAPVVYARFYVSLSGYGFLLACFLSFCGSIQSWHTEINDDFTVLHTKIQHFDDKSEP